MAERRLFNIAKAIDPAVGQGLPRPEPDVDESQRPACPNCHSRMLVDVSPVFPIPLPKDGVKRSCWRCSFCWQRVVIPPWGVSHAG